MEKEGDPPDPKLMQAIAAVTEFAGGVATVLGLATPLASAMLAATMATAIVQVHIPQRHPFIAPPGKPSAETCVVYLAIALVLLTIGPGILSIDAFLRSR
jgi:putative oxidoreductase